MSRSRRKTPITGITTKESDKEGKRAGNKAFRVAIREWLANSADGVGPALRESSNAATFPKDGKQYLGDRFPELMRK